MTWRPRLRGKQRPLVPHPRYGMTSVPAGGGYTEAMIRASHWKYRDATINPTSALPADITRQNYSVWPRTVYVDTLKQCRSCLRDFISYAVEQRFWYEELKFFVDSECLECCECRHSERELKRRHRRYASSAGRPELDDDEFAEMIGDAVYLFRAGLISDVAKLRRFKNLARKRVPKSKSLKALEGLLAELASAAG